MRASPTADGVVRTRAPLRTRALTAVAVALIAVVGVAGWVVLRPAPDPGAPAGPSRSEDRPPPPPAAMPRRDPLERAMVKALQTASEPPPPAVESAASDEPKEITIDQLPRGDGTGIDAFPRPGTKPILRGLIVPDGYDLPPGYVRHYQTTDDGEQLPPILRFHPDRIPPGAPADGVVPPELAPKDMPQVWLEPPPPKSKR
jgi:hypothetical protein